MAELLDIDIEDLDATGDGVAHYNGHALIVPFTLPGERVRVRVGPPRAGVTFAILDAVLRPSPHRVTPYCPHFGPRALRPADTQPGPGPCGGCAWQHIAYPEQLRLKTELVTRLVRAAVPGAPHARAMMPGAAVEYPWGYRHKVRFVFGTIGRTGRRDGALAMGHYVRGSRRILPVRECPVHDERGNELAFRLHAAFARANIPAATPNDPRPSLKSIAIRAGQGTPELMATLVLTADADKRLRTATRKVLDAPGAPSSFHVNVHPEEDGFVFGRDTRRLTGPERMREEVAGVSFLISATEFFPTNIRAADALIRLVLEAIPEPSHVLDLYAGAGLFALPLARAGHRVTAVEENRVAVADGEASLRLNRIPEGRCRFLATSVEQALGSYAARAPLDAVILDPPRDGCSAPVLARVFGDLAPATAVYISGNPETLARDLGEIVRHGYTVQSLQPVDTFPHTAHVETVAVLRRN